MAKEVEVLFTETKKGQFRVGDQKKVSVGYARNFLLPQKLAVLVTEGQVALLNKIRKQADKQREKLKETAAEIKKVLQDQVVKFEMKTHDEGKLYGSVTPSDVASQLNRNFETEIDKLDLIMEPHIKMIGTYSIGIDIHPDVDIQVKLEIVSQEENDNN